MNTRDEETIIAQCTPQGSGAIALLRMSGKNAFLIATQLSKLSSGKKISDLPTHTIHYGSVIDGEKTIIDNVLFLLMRTPKTFTGQDTVEITCHNNPFIIETILQQAILHGARIAENGEFTKRAFLHGKIDLIQAEAINEVIHASNQLTLKQSLAQLEGSFSHWITTIEKSLLHNLALSEASFEFIDDEIEFNKQILENMEHLLKTISKIKKTFNQQQQIREGIRIALLGSVNAGKSSLFNALLDKNRAIVTNIAGTTRDVIEAGMYKYGTYITLVDTAGLRQTKNVIEQEGIKRSLEEAHKADIILLVYDSSREITSQEKILYEQLQKNHSQKIILIHNKSDLPTKTTLSENISTSDKNAHSIEQLEQHVEEKVSALFSEIESPYVLNQRHYNLLLGLEKKLIDLLPLLQESNGEYELISYHLKDALEHISELTGKTISEQGMDTIFKEFCVGK